MSTTIRSARLPRSSEPICRSIPSARAPPIVAISSAVAAPTRAGIGGLQLVQERGHAHRLEHVEVVVAGGAVGAQAERHAGSQVAGDRRGAARQLHVAFGVVRHADAALLQDARCRHRTPTRRARPARPGPRKPRLSRYAVGDIAKRSCAALDLVARLGQVDERRHAVLARQLARGLQRGAVQRVHRVRRHGRRDQRIALERLDERVGARQAVGRASSHRPPGTG